MTPKENTLFMLKVYEHFGCSGPITQSQVDQYKSIKLGRLSQQEEETMNDNLNTEFKPVPTPGDNTDTDKTWRTRMSDEEFAKLMEAKSVDGEITWDDAVVYVTDTDEAADEPTPTVH